MENTELRVYLSPKRGVSTYIRTRFQKKNDFFFTKAKLVMNKIILMESLEQWNTYANFSSQTKNV